MDLKELELRFAHLSAEGRTVCRPNTRLGFLAAAEMCREAASVADLIGGAKGAACHVDAGKLLSHCLCNLGDMPAAARAACASLQWARASGSRSYIVLSLSACGVVAQKAPDEVFKAERESREQERLSGPPSYGGLYLSQEGRISLPTTPAALSRLDLAYYEATVATCDEALRAAGGRDSPATADPWCLPSLLEEANARGSLGYCLHELRKDSSEPQRSLELLRQAVALMRSTVRTANFGVDAEEANRNLAGWLCNLGGTLDDLGRYGTAEAAACMREAL